MPQKRLSMRKLKEVLRLHSLGLKQQQIARSCAIAQSTVHGYLKAATAAGVSWPLPPDWDEQRLEEALSGRASAVATRRKNHAPDFGAIRLQLQSHRNLTLQFVLRPGEGAHVIEFAEGGLAREEVAARIAALEAEVARLKGGTP